jgi:hypothetical protein
MQHTTYSFHLPRPKENPLIRVRVQKKQISEHESPLKGNIQHTFSIYPAEKIFPPHPFSSKKKNIFPHRSSQNELICTIGDFFLNFSKQTEFQRFKTPKPRKLPRLSREQKTKPQKYEKTNLEPCTESSWS